MEPPVALVTGAAHRLGRALAIGFGRTGHRVAVHFRSDRTAAEETCAALGDAGASGVPFHADLSEKGAAAALVASVLGRFGRLDVLVHSASPWLEGPVSQVTEADWDAVVSVGPRAGFFLAQAAAPALAAALGSVLLLSDVAASKAWPRHVPHAVAKAAVDALVRNLAVALAPGVRVNGLAPGIVLPPAELPREAVDLLVARTPLARPVGLDDLVSMAVAIAANRSMTGQVVAVDAGRSVV